jgi:hypothetical protein
MDERFRGMDERYKSLDQRMGRVESSISSLKTTIIVTALSAVIAIVLGVAALNATMFSNMLAAFESGKDTSAIQSELRRQAEETAVLLKRLESRIDSAKPNHLAPPPAAK